MKILITGGTGLIGRAIVQRLLLNKTNSLTVLSRSASMIKHPRLQWFQLDLLDNTNSLDELICSFDCVLHGAAHLSHQGPEDLVTSANLNFSFTTELFKKVVDAKVGKLIYLSGMNFLRKPLAKVIDESHEIAPNSPYSLAKYWGELALFNIAKDSQTKPIALRITSPIPDAVDDLPNTVIRKWLLSARQGVPITVFGQGSRQQDYVSTDDIAFAVGQTLTSGASGIINVASGKPISNLNVARLISKPYGVPILREGKTPTKVLSGMYRLRKQALYLIIGRLNRRKKVLPL